MTARPHVVNQQPYQDIILQHARSPRGYCQSLERAESVTLANPVCGDEVTVMRRWTAEGLLELGFHCQACLLCKASASVMVSTLSGLAMEPAAALVRLLQTTFPTPGPALPPNISADLVALYDLRRYPTRAQCVLLPWDAINKLLYN